jgi:hypothetical protein
MNNVGAKHTIRVIEYNSPLYRANSIKPLKNFGNVYGNAHYSTVYNKFFTTNRNETKSYANRTIKKNGTSYTKSWMPKSPLRLIDILDINTRQSLEHFIGPEENLLDTAFPIVNNKVYRYSVDETAEIDAKLLRAICSIKDADGNRLYDGYYMNKQTYTINSKNGRRILPFHSEIGLCSSALRKIKLNSGSVNEKRGAQNPTKKSKNNKPGINPTNNNGVPKKLSFF